MTKLTIEKIINETVFSMEVEGYILLVEEKETIQEVLKGNIAFSLKATVYFDVLCLSKAWLAKSLKNRLHLSYVFGYNNIEVIIDECKYTIINTND